MHFNSVRKVLRLLLQINLQHCIKNFQKNIYVIEASLCLMMVVVIKFKLNVWHPMSSRHCSNYRSGKQCYLYIAPTIGRAINVISTLLQQVPVHPMSNGHSLYYWSGIQYHHDIAFNKVFRNISCMLRFPLLLLSRRK